MGSCHINEEVAMLKEGKFQEGGTSSSNHVPGIPDIADVESVLSRK